MIHNTASHSISPRCEYVLTGCTVGFITKRPWSRVLEKLVVTQLVRKFPAFSGTRRFITVFTEAHH
jgi:hypothetical protein